MRRKNENQSEVLSEQKWVKRQPNMAVGFVPYRLQSGRGEEDARATILFYLKR